MFLVMERFTYCKRALREAVQRKPFCDKIISSCIVSSEKICMGCRLLLQVRGKVKFCRNWDISYSKETIFLFEKQIIQQQKHRGVTIVK